MNHQNVESDYKQKENEGLLEFANRLATLWNKEEETTIEIFFELFIEGIRDNEVKRRTKIWFEELGNTEIFKNCIKEEGMSYTKVVMDTIEQFQKEKDEKQKDEDDEIVLLETESESDFDESDVNLSDFELESDFENDSKNFETGSGEEDGKTEIANLIKSIDESLKDIIVDPEEFQKENDKFKKEFQKDGKKAIENLIKSIDESLKEEEDSIKRRKKQQW